MEQTGKLLLKWGFWRGDLKDEKPRELKDDEGQEEKPCGQRKECRQRHWGQHELGTFMEP